MTCVAIMQPTYLPWVGYFDLMDQVDHFVLLDTVQFARRSWQQRNRIRAHDGLTWLTVPVRSRGRYKQTIEEVELRDEHFVDKHLRAIEHHYSAAPWYAALADVLEETLRSGASTGRLTALNERLIHLMARGMGITTPVVRASALDLDGRRSDLLCQICRTLGADDYLSPPGSLDYLLEDRAIFERRGVRVWLQSYEHPQWPQRHDPFMAYTSALDLWLNVGDNALEVLRSGRRPARSLYDFAPRPAAEEELAAAPM